MKTPEQQSEFFPEFSDKMIIKEGIIVVINNDEAVAFSDLVKCWNARADLVDKAREWCEQLSSEPSFDYLEGEHRITNGEYERANDLLAFLEAEVGK